MACPYLQDGGKEWFRDLPVVRAKVWATQVSTRKAYSVRNLRRYSRMGICLKDDLSSLNRAFVNVEIRIAEATDQMAGKGFNHV